MSLVKLPSPSWVMLHGISPDPQKTTAIKEMLQLITVSELRRLMGIINQLGKFFPNIVKISAPLQKLLSQTQVWQWGSAQENSYKQLQIELTKPTVLKLYDTLAPTKISVEPHYMALVLYCFNMLTTLVSYSICFMCDDQHRSQVP